MKWSRLLFGLLAALVAGCAVPQPPSLQPQVSVADLQQILSDSGQRFHSLKGLARVEVIRGEDKLAGSQVLLAEKPDRVRSEALALFGQPWLVLAADGRNMQVFIPGQKRFYQGAASPENLQRFTRLPLRLTDLVHLLLYQVPLLDGRPELGQSPSGPLLTLVDDQGYRQELGFDRELRLISSRYLDAGGEPWLSVAYSEFLADRDGFPAGFDLQMPAYRLTAAVRFREVEPNAPIPAEKFTLQPPAGVDITPLEVPEEKP